MNVRRFDRRVHWLETHLQGADDLAAARAQAERDRQRWRSVHCFWLEPLPGGVRCRINWEPWMGSWPTVAALIDEFSVAAHDGDIARFKALCAQYWQMMSKRPARGE
jgi:hypothetical protein